MLRRPVAVLLRSRRESASMLRRPRSRFGRLGRGYSRRSSKSAVLRVRGCAAMFRNGNSKSQRRERATVEIRDDELIGSDLITTVTTDSHGNYSASFTHDDGLLQGDPDIFVRVLASSNVANVKPDGGSTYYIESAVQNEVADGTNLTINLTAGNTDDNETAFSIHHAMAAIGAYAGTLAGKTPSKIDIIFPGTGSFYSPSGGFISLVRGDRWDWDVMHHEYGHYFQATQGFVNSPGGKHGLNDNLAQTRGSKDVGIRLAWSEGWVTYFGIAGQQRMGMASLGIPNVGDTSYSDTEDANFSYNVETRTGVGEDNELSVTAALWDMYDAAGDGVDEVSMGDKRLFDLVKGAGATTVGAAWEAIAAALTTEARTLAGKVFGQNEIAPVLTAPADNLTPDSSNPPTFTWEPNGGGAPNPLNDFRIRFYKNDFSSVIFERELGNVTSFTPTAAEWTTILAGDSVIKWVVEGQNTSAPATPGGTLGRYWSGARTIGGISIVFVIDDTGSMWEEIGAVRAALQKYINEVESRLPADATPPTIQLITFKDYVTTRITSNNLAAVRSAVGSLTASGGGDCPEYSAQALARAADTIAPGGTILLATDASTQPGVDMSAVIARLRAKGVTVNTILSGDCSGIPSAAAAAEGGEGEVFGPALASSPCCSDEIVTPGILGLSGKVSEDPALSDDSPAIPVIDAGQPPVDDHGDTAATATRLLVNEPAVGGSIGVAPDELDFFVFALEAGTTYKIPAQVGAGGYAYFYLLDRDGLSVLNYRGLSTGYSYSFVFTPAVSGDYFLRVQRSATPTPVSYSVSVEEDPLAGLTSAVQLFSTVSSLTGGAFFVHDEVNYGSSEEYEAAMFNVMVSTLGPVVLAANPDKLPQAETLGLTLVGRRTNWRSGSTTVTIPGDGLEVLAVDVLSATSLTALVRTAGDAPLGFRDVIVETTVGAGVETAQGSDVLEVVSPITVPAILSVEPNAVSRGMTTTFTIRGANTSWDAGSVVTLGTGITVTSTVVVSPTLIEADAVVDGAADIGFRTAQVTTPGQGTQQKTRALFVNAGSVAIPEIVEVAPDTGFTGRTLDVQITGMHTNFEAGVTSAVFGPGIEVLAVKVSDALHAQVTIEIAPEAAPGYYDVALVTGPEVAVLLDGFFVELGVLGNVAVHEKGKLLFVAGDADAVSLDISQNEAGQLVVAGRGGTTINGGQAPFVASAAVRSIYAAFGTGNDVVRVHDVDIRCDLSIFTSAGNDWVLLDNVTVGDDLKILGGADDDHVSFTSVACMDLCSVDTGGGDDVVIFDHVMVDRNLRISSSDGDDLVARRPRTWKSSRHRIRAASRLGVLTLLAKCSANSRPRSPRTTSPPSGRSSRSTGWNRLRPRKKPEWSTITGGSGFALNAPRRTPPIPSSTKSPGKSLSTTGRKSILC